MQSAVGAKFSLRAKHYRSTPTSAYHRRMSRSTSARVLLGFGLLACNPSPDVVKVVKTEPAPAPAPASDPAPAPVPTQQVAPTLPPAPPTKPMPVLAMGRLDHAGPVVDLAWSGDGSRIATACIGVTGDGEVWVWNADSNERVHTLAPWPSPPLHVALSQDGKTVVAHAGDEIRVYDEAELRHTLKHAATSDAAITPDASRVASAGADGVRIWSDDAKLVHHVEQRGKQAVSVVFSLDGKRLASSWDDGRVRLIDVENGELVGKPIGNGSPETLCYDGRRIAMASSPTHLQVYEADSGTLASTVERSPPFAFGLGGNLLLASGPAQAMGHPLTLVDAGPGLILRDFFGHEKAIRAAVFTADGNRMASASEDATVLIWATP
jgi:WD40 repeat protein